MLPHNASNVAATHRARCCRNALNALEKEALKKAKHFTGVGVGPLSCKRQPVYKMRKGFQGSALLVHSPWAVEHGVGRMDLEQTIQWNSTGGLHVDYTSFIFWHLCLKGCQVIKAGRCFPLGPSD